MILLICRSYKLYFIPGLLSHRWFWLQRQQLVPLDEDEKEPPRQMPCGPSRHGSVRGNRSPTERQTTAGADLRSATTSRPEKRYFVENSTTHCACSHLWLLVVHIIFFSNVIQEKRKFDSNNWPWHQSTWTLRYNV